MLDFPDLTGQAGRCALATLVFAAVSWLGRRGWVRVSGRDWVRLAALAAVGLVAFNVLLLTALRHADPAVVGTIVGGKIALILQWRHLSNHRESGRKLAPQSQDRRSQERAAAM